MLLILFFLLLIIILIITGKLNIKVEMFEIENIGKKIVLKYSIILELIVCKYIKILKVRINNKQQTNMIKKLSSKVNKIDIKTNNTKKQIEVIKRIVLNIKDIDIIATIGLDSLIATVYINTFIASLIPILLRKYSDTRYRVVPLYNMGNKIRVIAKCTVEVKILNTLYRIFLERKDYKDGRKRKKTSNRRAYDYCNG